VKITNYLGAVAIALSGMMLATAPAEAVTVINDGGTYFVGAPGSETQFTGNILAAGGAGSWSVTFDSSPFETTGFADATIGNIAAAAFSGLTMSWESVVSGVLSSTPITPVVTTLNTDFTAPDDLVQNLVISWTDSQAGAGFDVEVTVAAIPLPASVLLLLGALGGLGLVSRRRRTSA
jgi:hypothetical protein